MGSYYDKISFEAQFNACRREHYARWLGDPSFNVAITLNFNGPISVGNAGACIGTLFRDVDRVLLGSRFNKYRDARTEGVFFFEHVNSNIHAHGLLQVQPSRVGRFMELFPECGRGIWSDVWKSGTQFVRTAHDPAGFARYITKEQFASSSPETMVILSDFYAQRG
ncbi:hypothetical protein [Caulobacter sp. FWC2]|uniref:hypothetical protein n=1 Tax=Caulobacter sp. FWC2 TaxID=69664 RepID=UPI00117761FC|nr:hypothetical protein [Caulobacter sp. FWC2]